MNDGLLLVNFGELDNASANIGRALATLTNDLAELERKGNALKDTWSGSAKDAYEQRQDRWQAASRDLQTILQDIRNALDRSKTDYHDTERAATNRFQ
jgi:early secretory antigenic target protein ESAT-6